MENEGHHSALNEGTGIRMKDASVEFVHYKATLTDQVLSQFGSRYLSRTEAGIAVRKWGLPTERVNHVILVANTTYQLQEPVHKAKRTVL